MTLAISLAVLNNYVAPSDDLDDDFEAIQPDVANVFARITPKMLALLREHNLYLDSDTLVADETEFDFIRDVAERLESEFDSDSPSCELRPLCAMFDIPVSYDDVKRNASDVIVLIEAIEAYVKKVN